MNTDEVLSIQKNNIFSVTHICENTAGVIWQKGVVAGVYRNCFNILTEDRYLLTVFRRTDRFSTRALISDINIDINSLPISNGDTVYRKDGVISVGNLRLQTDNPHIISVKRVPFGAALVPDNNMRMYKGLVLRYAKASPLFGEGYLKTKAETGFGVLNRNLREGFELLLGLGIGLTPSCDDVIAGMAAYFFLLDEGGRFLRELGGYLAQKGSRVTTAVSKNLLEDVVRGYINPALYNLICAIVCNPEHIEKHTMELMDYGSTSGIETCMGILYAHMLINEKEQIEWL